MATFVRSQLATLSQRLAESRRFLQVLVGPRQVGKTTLLRQLLATTDVPHRYVSADNAGESGQTWLAQQWQIARLELRRSAAAEYWLIVDEVQKIPDWSTVVKAAWDADSAADRDLKVVLSGSAQLLMQKGLSESLAGRFELIYMPHWSLAEMQTAFDFTPEQFVWFGGYPGAAALISDETRWTDYIRNAFIETTIAKDILMMNEVRKPALLRQLFELACVYSGQVLSYNKMLGQLLDAGNTTTLAHYLKLLASAGLVTGMERYSGNATKQKASSPRLNVLNTAFLPIYSNYTFQTVLDQPDVWGRHVESAVGAHLLNRTRFTDLRVYYWRDGNLEVDFVIEKRGRLIAVEVKSGRTRRNKGLAAFQQRFAPEQSLLVGGDGLAWETFLTIDPAELF